MKQTGQQETLSEFVADEGGADSTDANAMLVAAYMAFWLAVFVFIALSWRRQRGLADRLDRLETALASSRDSAVADDSRGAEDG